MNLILFILFDLSKNLSAPLRSSLLGVSHCLGASVVESN